MGIYSLENLGSRLAMSPDDRFLPQGNKIFPKICQVQSIPYMQESEHINGCVGKGWKTCCHL